VRAMLGQNQQGTGNAWIPGFGRARGVQESESIMSETEIINRFETGELTWADLLEITGLPAHVLFSILFGE